MITRAEESLSHFHNACTNREQRPVVFPHSRQRAGDGAGGGRGTVAAPWWIEYSEGFILNVPVSSVHRQNAKHSEKGCLAACCDPCGFPWLINQLMLYLEQAHPNWPDKRAPSTSRKSDLLQTNVLKWCHVVPKMMFYHKQICRWARVRQSKDSELYIWGFFLTAWILVDWWKTSYQ